MNCTNSNNEPAAPETKVPVAATVSSTEIPPFKARCNRMGIHVPGDNPTPAEIIPYIEQRLAAHQKHRSKTANPWTGDFIEWKNINDAYQEFLTDLRAANRPTPPITPTSPIPSIPIPNNTAPNKILPAKPGQNPSKKPQSPHPQQTTSENQTRTEPGLNPDNPELTQTEPESARTETEQSAHASAPSSGPAPQAEADPDDDAPNIKSDDEDLIEAATHLHLHLKARSRFDKLPPENQAAIIHLLDRCKPEVVLKLIAQPPPVGFSLKAGRTALLEFRRRYEKRAAERRRNDNSAAALELVRKVGDPNQAFLTVLQIRALTAAADPTTSLGILDAYASTLGKLRKQTLAERKQDHAEKPK